MYEQHFGLQKRPFGVKATGSEVFVGPQTAKTMAGFRKALSADEAVVTVSGAAGTGKTTLVERALGAIDSKYKTIRVGRMQLNASDVLESLLIVLGIQDRPTGTIQRFTTLRRKLRELQEAETRVFILVEDALRTGVETLAELEALTAADAGESDGASIILMGDERLAEFMMEPQLAQLQQRVRQRHRIKPLCAAELRGYLRHCLRHAGGDFDQLFDDRSADLVHALCDGIPRVANNIVDAVMMSAAAQGINQISARFVATVAEDEFGLTVEDFDFSLPDAETTPAETEAAPPLTADTIPEATPTAAQEARTASDEKHTAEDKEPAAQTAPTPVPEADAIPEATPAAAQEARTATEAKPSAVNEMPAAQTEPTPPLEADAVPEVVPTVTHDVPVVNAAAAPTSATMPAPEPTQVETDPLPELTPESPRESAAAKDPVIVFADDEAESPADSSDVPQLIQDTLPDLAILSSRYAKLEESYLENPPEDAMPPADSPADDIPELQVEPQSEPPQSNKASPAPEPSADTVAAEEIPKPAATGEPEAKPQWELTKEPEFELVTEVVPTIDIDAADQSANAAGEAELDIPELHAEPAPAPAAEDIPELKVELEPLVAAEPPSMPAVEQAPAAEQKAPAVVEPPAAKPQASSQADDNAAQAAKQEDANKADVPEWDRDPTLAQLKPDLDALEQALAFTHGEPAVKAPAKVNPEELAKSVAEPDELPEITLDKSIETGIDNLDIEEPSDIQPPTPVKKPDPELDRIAADIANAKSIEDIDDIMAETLFGSGISIIAAQVTANPPKDDSANDELELVQEAPKTPPPAAKAPPAAANMAPPTEFGVGEEISIETRTPVANTGLDLSASQRLKTVRALNADLPPSLRDPEDAPAKKSAGGKVPETIEDQINTSITQTLKALKVPQEILDDDEPEEEKKKGFLSRFRRS